jgi:hypothetical protein
VNWDAIGAVGEVVGALGVVISLRAFILAITYSSSCAQVVVLSGYADRAAPWLFFLGLLACLGDAALGFVRLMFIRPSAE